MTIPNFITIIRLLLIPVFVMCVLYYVTDREGPEPSELLRWWATAIFITAAISDGVDGYIARRFNQRSELGAVLVPLLLPILVVSRDLFILVGFMVLKLVLGVKVEVRAHWSGKVATALTMVVIAMVLLRWTNSPLYDVTLFGAGTCILVSLLVYVFRGIMQVNQTPAPSR
jgi:cardiolipin synthase (CMP-forming)